MKAKRTGDFKVDYTPVFGDAIDLQRFAEIGKKGVLALMSDSTNAERKGFTQSERTVGITFDHIFAEHQNTRIIIATFASNVDRVQQIINSAYKYGRKVVVEGRSMVNIITTASELGYLNVPENTLIEIDQLKNYPPEKTVLITTGSQGESMAALSRMAGDVHRKVTIQPNDTIIFSSNPIPGNEKAVSRVINELSAKGANVIFQDAHVRYADGREWGSRSGDEFPFDPGALVDDDGRVYLYSGFATKVPFIMSRFHNLRNSGGVGMELEQDMLTIKDKIQLIFPQKDNNPPKDFAGHAFFEASSIRKIDGKYVFVYSSENNHELCYAVSEHPLSGYRYGGTLVDLGDLYMEDGTSDETCGTNYLGNTHGGMAELNGQWYIFYHRQTNQHSYSRQACAEPLKRTPDGGFQQAEVTSCGLNGGPLDGIGEYEARIACNLWSKHGVARYDKRFNKKEHPYFTQSGRDGDPAAVQYIANMRDGSVCGFKYFQMHGAKAIRCAVSGVCRGNIEVSDTPEFSTLAASIPVEAGKTMTNVTAPFRMADGVKALYFRFRGEGAMNFFAFELS